MLRASSKSEGKAIALRGVLTPELLKVKVEGEELLIPFADAAVKHERDKLAKARDQILAAMGSGALVDAAALVGNFERMNRIADASGITLGEMGNMFRDIIVELDLKH